MRAFVEIFRSGSVSRAGALLLVGASIAGCSSEAVRFNDNPYAGNRRNDVTGSVAAPPPSNRVETQQLPPPPQAHRPQTVGSSGGGPGMGSYQPQPQATYQTQGAQPSAPPTPASYAPHNADVTGTVPQRPRPAPAPPPAQNSSQWDWNGGTAVSVAPGDNVDSLSRKYGVPSSAIMQANNLNAPVSLYPGQRIIIPRLNAAGTAPATRPAKNPAMNSTVKPMPANLAGAPAAPAAQPGGQHVHVVAPGETLHSISRRYHKPLASIATANRIAPHTLVKVGDRIAIPGVTAAAGARTAATALPAPQRVANAEPTQTARLATPAPETRTDTNTAVAEPTGGAPSFRWPVKGRVISGFGAKNNGQPNDGVNLAVPEGTAVRSAEDGVVAYAGNELKGYGNLILVRHADGFVTAYAHAKELMVKRGDQIRRGQVIAKSGQTGSVTSPQLHFEIRKGSTPVDPAQHLPGA